MPSWKKVILSGSDASLNSLYVNGPITGSDVQIDDWGSVSASLAAISTSGSTQNLQQVTDNGNTTTNSITAASFTGSLFGTASYASQALTSSYSLTATSSSHALNADNAISSSHALNADNAISSSYAATATSSSHALNADNAITASYALQALSSSYAITSSYTLNALSASYAATASSANQFNVRTALTASNLIYPVADGLANQSIVTDGAGNLTFGNPTSGNTVITIKNVSGGAIAKGTPLYITASGTSGNLVGVWPADAGNPARMPAGVIAGEDLPNNGDEGIGLINGFINGVDTSAFASGDQVYVAVGGGYTNVAPTGSALVQKLGNVEKSDNNNGSGVINGPGAARSVPNINPGYTWVGDGDWVATPVSTASLFVTSGSHALNADNAISASYAATAISASHALNANNAISSSYAATATSSSHALNADNAISSSHAIFADTASFLPASTNLNIASITASNAVFQSASISYLQTVTGSAIIVGQEYIILNTDTPAARYAGMVVIDSGSVGVTASLVYDSVSNDWKFFHEDAGTSDYSNVIFGPVGTDPANTPELPGNYIVKAQNDGHGHHITSSNLYDDGSRVSSAVSLTVTGSITGSDVTIDDWGSISASLASIEAGVATQNLQDVTDNGNTTTNSITVTGFTSSITGGNGITGTFRSTDGYNRLFLISSGSSGINPGQVNIVLRDQTGGVNNDGTITYGGNNGSTFKIKTVNNVEFQLLGSTTDRSFSFSQGDTGSLYWDGVTPFIQRTGSGQTQFLGLATSASYASQALSSSFATTASYVATASYTPTLQQVTTQGSITNTSVTFTGSAANSLQIVNSSGDIPFISVSGSVNTTIGRLVDVVYNALPVSANSTTTIAQLPAPKVAGFTFDYIAYVSGNVLQAGRAGVVKGILRNTDSGAGITKGFQINETTTLDLIDQGFGTEGLQFSIVQDTNGTSNQLVAITNNTWPYTINYTLTIYYNPDFS